MSTATEVDRPSLEIGDRVRLKTDREHNWWTVQAVSPNFTAVVRQAPFQGRGVFEYTVLDWRNGVRGPCDLIGQGWGDGSYSAKECAAMLEEFENHDRVDPAMTEAFARGDAAWIPSFHSVEISRRNNVPLHVLEVRKVATK